MLSDERSLAGLSEQLRPQTIQRCQYWMICCLCCSDNFSPRTIQKTRVRVSRSSIWRESKTCETRSESRASSPHKYAAAIRSRSFCRALRPFRSNRKPRSITPASRKREYMGRVNAEYAKPSMAQTQFGEYSAGKMLPMCALVHSRSM